MSYLIVMGAGLVGHKVYDHVLPGLIEKYEGVFFFDNDTKKQGTFLGNIRILSKSEVNRLISNVSVSIIIATDLWREIYTDCMKLGVEKNIVAIYTNLNFSANPYLRHCYSQEGEEFFLREKFRNREKGFYVDVGAHHPYRLSNTYWAYMLGWRGINIEPNVDVAQLFTKERPDDINLNCGISLEKGELNYYRFTEPSLNTFNTEEFGGIREPEEVTKVKVERLDSILEKYSVKHIDFLNVDVEGLEMEVLQSNNWNKYKPDIILIEQKRIQVDKISKTDIHKFLVAQGYICDCKSIRTAIYTLTGK